MNNENLVDNNKRTPRERRENAQKAGKASGVSRRRNKSMKTVFQNIKYLPVQDSTLKQQLEAVGIKDEETTYAAALAWSTIYHAMKGNSQMMRLAFEMMGETPEVIQRGKEIKLKEKALNASLQNPAGDAEAVTFTYEREACDED